MSKINDILLYFCAKYPHPHELSKARISKMVYLADWYSSLESGHQLTGLKWYFHNYGPYLKEIAEVAQSDKSLEVFSTTNFYGGPKELVRFKSGVRKVQITLSRDEISILERVIKKTKDLYWDDFVKLIYETYPITSQPRYSSLDLPELAKQVNGNS